MGIGYGRPRPRSILPDRYSTAMSHYNPASLTTTPAGGFWSSRRRAGISGLIIFGWRGSIALIVVGLAISFLLFGYWYPYSRFADMDLMVIYQGFVLSGGDPQTFFDHPDHLTLILLHGWFRLLHGLGLLDVVALAKIPPPSDVAGFEAAWTAAVRAGRVLSLILAESLVVTFAVL